jgi:nitroimidazol reductase NimA-like FMN-containing flavoprotein (pyridoxamine 5'-phosphate oxidase superfamily)
MSIHMTREEREAFLADVHVAVIGIENPGHPPIVVPVWYDYEPSRGVRVVTEGDSLKGRLLRAAMRFSLVVQTEVPPDYKYVEVEGPVVAVGPASLEEHRRPLARRYLGRELGDRYVAATPGEGDLVFSMRPERWRTVDYAKADLG